MGRGDKVVRMPRFGIWYRRRVGRDMGRSRAVAIVMGVACGAGLIAAGVAFWPTHTARPLLAWNDAATVSAGHEVYIRNCGGCHGSLEGGNTAAGHMAPPHDATGHTWQHPDFALFQMTKTGEIAAYCATLDGSGMPQFEQALNDREIVAVLSYIKSTWPAEVRAEQETVNSLYAAQNAAYRALLDAAQ